MNWSKNELINLKDKNFTFSTKLEFHPDEFSNYHNLNSLKDINVFGKAYFEDTLLTLTLNLDVTGIMLVPCAITLKEIEYPFEISQVHHVNHVRHALDLQ